MYIITEKPIKDRFSDGIDTILNLSEDDFNKLIDMLSIKPNKTITNSINLLYSTDYNNHPEKPIELGLLFQNEKGYACWNAVSYQIPNFMSQLESFMSTLEPGSDKYIRCSKIISTRNIDALKKAFSGKNGEYSELIDKLFDILINPDICEKFINFEANEKFFEINGTKYQIEDYLTKFRAIFRYRYDAEGEEKAFFIGKFLIENFYLQENVKSTINQNATQIYKAYHQKYTRYIDQRYTFIITDNDDDYKTYRNGDEPNWTVNEELKTAIFAICQQIYP